MTQDGFVKVIWQTETGSEINLLCWCHSDSECLDDVSSSSHDFFWRCLTTLDCFPNSKQRHDLRSHALTNRSAHQLEIFQIFYASSHLYDRSFWYSGGPWFPRHTVFHTCHTISGTQHFAFYNWCRLSAWPEHHWTMWLSEKGLSFCRFDILIWQIGIGSKLDGKSSMISRPVLNRCRFVCIVRQSEKKRWNTNKDTQEEPQS